MLSLFAVPLVLAVLGLTLGAGLGYVEAGTAAAAVSGAFTCAALGVLEISLSLDNAIVNARVLRNMDATWRRRFLTWGIIVAVIGMRIVFPLAIVAIAARIGPLEAIRLAVVQPDAYARALAGAHLSISAFGGSFLLMVALRYFFDLEKRVHWVELIEARAALLGGIRGLELALALIVVVALSAALPTEGALEVLRAGLYGLIAFVAVEGLGHLLRADPGQVDAVRRSGVAAFVYLEVLDASFSFDAVIGAFALTRDIFVIAIGLGVGAAFVRASTVMMVERGTLAKYRFLEHGAFYAIFALALNMDAETIVDVPDVVTGLVGTVLIALAMLSSVLWARNHPGDVGSA